MKGPAWPCSSRMISGLALVVGLRPQVATKCTGGCTKQQIRCSDISRVDMCQISAIGRCSVAQSHARGGLLCVHNGCNCSGKPRSPVLVRAGLVVKGLLAGVRHDSSLGAWVDSTHCGGHVGRVRRLLASPLVPRLTSKPVVRLVAEGRLVGEW